MKLLLVIAVLVLGTGDVFAASTLFCKAEDGTQITATESADVKGQLFDIKLSVRGEEEKSFPGAYAAKMEDKNGTVTFMVITDPTEGILVVVRNNSLIDATGVYSVETCEIGM